MPSLEPIGSNFCSKGVEAPQTPTGQMTGQLHQVLAKGDAVSRRERSNGLQQHPTRFDEEQ
jgi:hypothetical protein